MRPLEKTDAQKAQGRRNVAIALALLAFVGIVFFVTVARLGADVLNRPL